MTHPIHRVVTRGTTRRAARSSSPMVRPCPCTPTSSNRIGFWWTSGALATPVRIVANLHPRDRGGLVPGRGPSGIVVRAADRRVLVSRKA